MSKVVESKTTNCYGHIVSMSKVLFEGQIYEVGECDGFKCNLYQNGKFKIGGVNCDRKAIDEGTITPF